ncbi:MAG: pantoate--beta-alanine ligase [Firmicutes bacterium]|nr:pantoate--beta-alanine ligase [Bacillota bacterium]
MKIISNPDEVQKISRKWKTEGLTIGLVPTMGYLHEGHQSLIHKSCAQNDRTIVSVFVNPIQFAPGEDLATYPRDLDADAALCASEGADILFHPQPSDMYGEYFSTHVEVDDITQVLCGKTRPTHFKGVTTVVSKLFNISKADRAYFGEKDAQQLAVIKRMVEDLNFDIEITGCPIVREADGLAKSSRNKYLNPEERKAALVLSRSLSIGKQLLDNGERNANVIRNSITQEIKKEQLAEIDYVSIVDSVTLKDVDEKITAPVLTAIAVKIGSTRLIDNFSYTV